MWVREALCGPCQWMAEGSETATSSASFLKWIPGSWMEEGFFKKKNHSFIGDQRLFFPSALFPRVPVSCSVSCLVLNWVLGGSMTFFFLTFSAKGIEHILIQVSAGWRTGYSPHVARRHEPACFTVCCTCISKCEEATSVGEGTMLFLLL